MNKSKLLVSIVVLGVMLVTVFGQAAAAETGKTPAVAGAQPWMVGLVDSSSANAHEGHFCGGSLIAPQWVLTAAHCVEETSRASAVDVVIGRYQLSSNAGERISAADIAIHPGYPDHEDNADNDIALIRLSRPATQGTPISLIKAANEYTDDPGIVARVTGWGVLSEESEENQDVLHGVDIPVVTQAACQGVYGSDLMADALCAGQKDGGADSCYGDSGGPLFSQDRSGNPVQIGIVSWGDECGAAGNYGVYARLTAYTDWINGVMAGTAVTIQPSDMPTENVVQEADWGEDENIADWPNIVLPQGFELAWADANADESFTTYEDDQGAYVDILASAGTFDFADEDASTLQSINGSEVLFFTENDAQVALFNIDGKGLEIYGTISLADMQQLIQSLIG